MSTRKALWLSALLVVGCLAVFGISRAIAGDWHFGFGVNSNATARDVGLPYYPGARPHKEHHNDDSAANVWGSFGSFGMKVVAVDLETSDPPAKVASFYWGPLGKYGPVLDCSYGKPRPPKAEKHSMRLDCEDDHPKVGELQFRVGTKREFHVVAVEPLGTGSRIALVYIQLRGIDIDD